MGFPAQDTLQPQNAWTSVVGHPFPIPTPKTKASRKAGVCSQGPGLLANWPPDPLTLCLSELPGGCEGWRRGNAKEAEKVAQVD